MIVSRALTIAGSAARGGAGIQADIKTFQELDVFGTSAITAIVAKILTQDKGFSRNQLKRLRHKFTRF